MQPIIIIDNECITLRYLPAKKIVHHTIHKPIDGQAFRDALDAGGRVLKENGACKWLSDDRQNGPLSFDMMVAGPKQWAPGMVAAGWKNWALVVPEQVAAAGTLVPVIDTLFELGLRMMVFTDVEKALAWLESIEG